MKATATKVWGFNTGRLYQADGQRISVAEMSDGRVLFADHSRGIFGALKHWRGAFGPLTARDVMVRYDHNEYAPDHDAMAITADEWPKEVL